jgi:hypothetical protein
MERMRPEAHIAPPQVIRARCRVYELQYCHWTGRPSNGCYTLTVYSGSVSDSNGGPLDGNGDVFPGGNYVSPPDTYGADGLHLYRLFGDVNGDGVVDASDVGQLKLTFNRNNTDPLYLAYLDADNCGAVDAQEIGQLKSRFNANVFG